jgi:hypothetical protein
LKVYERHKSEKGKSKLSRGKMKCQVFLVKVFKKTSRIMEDNGENIATDLPQHPANKRKKEEKLISAFKKERRKIKL